MIDFLKIKVVIAIISVYVCITFKSGYSFVLKDRELYSCKKEKK